MTTETSSAWYQKPLRIAALQTGERGLGQGALPIWKDLGFNVEQLHHAIADDYFAMFDPARHADLLRDYIAAAHAQDIRVILYLNTHMLSHLEPEKHEEWGGLTKDGKPWMGYGAYRMGCVNTPWVDALIESARAACHLGVDGIFSDGPVAGCYCEKCRALFKAQYGDLDVGGSAYAEFGRRSILDFMRRSYQAIKEINPDIIYYQNLDVHHAGAEEFLPYNDIVGTEGGFMFYGPPKNGYLWRPSIAAKMLEAVAPDKPAVIFAAGDQKSWARYPHAPGETTLLFASSVANGASVWYGIHFPLQQLTGPSADAARAINLFLAANEAWFEDTTSAARVALLRSSTSAALYSTSTEASDFYARAGGEKIKGAGNVEASFNAFAAMLYRSQIPFDVVMEYANEAALRRYDCIVLPTAPCLSDTAVENLRAYVAGGGHIIACHDVALFDDKGTPRADLGLADVLGVKYLQANWEHAGYDYISLADEASPFLDGINSRLLPSPLNSLQIEPTTAHVLAHCHGKQPGQYVTLPPATTPALVHNFFGDGQALYFASTLGEHYADFATPEHKQLTTNAVRHFAAAPVTVTGGPESLEVTHRRKRDGSADSIHLVNYTGGMSRPITAVMPLHDLEMSVVDDRPIKRITALMHGGVLNYAAREDGTITLQLPVVNAYEVIVVEWAGE